MSEQDDLQQRILDKYRNREKPKASSAPKAKSSDPQDAILESYGIKPRAAAPVIPNQAAASAEAAQRGLASGLSGPDARLIAMGSAVNDVGENFQRFGQWAGELGGVLGPNDRAQMDKRLSADDEAFRVLNEEQPTNTMLGRGLAQAGMFMAVPGGATGGLIRRMATGAAAGGATAGISSGVDQDPLEQTAIGAAFGVAMPVAGKALGAGKSFIQKKIPAITRAFHSVMGGSSGAMPSSAKVFTDTGEFTPEALQWMQRSELTPAEVNAGIATKLRDERVLAPEEMQRFNLFKDFDEGFQPTRAQVTQKATDFQAQQEARKKSGTVLSVLDRQEEVIANKVGTWVESLGGQFNNKAAAGRFAADHIHTTINSYDDAVEGVYERIRMLAPGTKQVQPNNLVRALVANQSDNAASSGLIASIRGDLIERGIIVKGQKNLSRITPELAEEVRKNINAVVRGDSGKRSRIGAKLKEALDADVAAAYGDDFFAPAREVKRNVESMLERARKTRRGKTGDSLLLRMVEDGVNPDTFVDTLVSKTTRLEDVTQVIDFMGPGPALDELRSALVADLYTKSASGKTELGGLNFSGKAFDKELNKIGIDKLRAILPSDMVDNLNRLRLIGEMRTPVSGTALGLGPSGQAVGELKNEFMKAVDSKTFNLGTITANLFKGRRAQSSIINPTAQTARVIGRAQNLPVGMPPAAAVGAVGAGQPQPMDIEEISEGEASPY